MSELTPADVLAGFPLGSVGLPALDMYDRAATPGDPWSALEEVLLPALAAPPLGVSFSGGRDSSLLLAVAVSAARRHGLPPPVAITMRFPHAADTDESEWQDVVVRSLGVVDREFVTPGAELDYLGPLATAGLNRHGLAFPPNGHFIVPVARALGQGTVVTGIGGDDLLATWRWRSRLAALRRPWADGIRRGPKAVHGVLLGAAPARVRRLVFERRLMRQLRRGREGFGWLTPAGHRAIRAGLVEAENQPVSWPGFIDWTSRQRSTIAVEEAVRRLARAEGVEASAPLLEPAVLAALAAARGGRGWVSRSEAMIDIVGDRLPAEVATRKSKASFVHAFWGPQARAFAAGWDGSGVDPERVDVDALRAEWCSARPDFRSTLLLQSAWLNTQSPAQDGRA